MKNLKDAAAAEGHPEYAQPWAMPATAVEPYHRITSEGTPGMAPANPAEPEDFDSPKQTPGRTGREVRI